MCCHQLSPFLSPKHKDPSCKITRAVTSLNILLQNESDDNAAVFYFEEDIFVWSEFYLLCCAASFWEFWIFQALQVPPMTSYEDVIFILRTFSEFFANIASKLGAQYTGNLKAFSFKATVSTYAKTLTFWSHQLLCDTWVPIMLHKKLHCYPGTLIT